jgi:hypothetical protein
LYLVRGNEGPTPCEAKPPPSAPRVRLVVVETGASDVDASAAPAAGEQTIVIAQIWLERPLAFARRTVEQILALELQGRSIESTIFVWAPRSDPEATEARLLLARGLVTHSASAVSLARSPSPSSRPRLGSLPQPE